jgi:DNA repair ATPase RecN
MDVMQSLIQQVKTLLQTAEDAERKSQEKEDDIRILRAELSESKRLVEYWKKIAIIQQQQHQSQPSDELYGVPKTIEKNYGTDTLDSKTWTSTLSISSNRSVVIQEINDAIDELDKLPSDLPEVLVMMDNILKVRKYYQYLWLEATCETTQRFGHWTKLRLQARNLQGDPVVAWYNGGRWAPREKEDLKSFTALLVDLQEEFETLCDD